MRFFWGYLFIVFGSSAVLAGVSVRDLVELRGAQANLARRALAQIESQLALQNPAATPYPLPPKADPPQAETPSPYTLVFVGDAMLSRGVDYMVQKYGAGDFRYPFLKIADELQKVDFLFGNLEGPISERGADQGSIYSFRANPKVVAGLQFVGFDAMSVANNHIFDWGRDALVDTLSVLAINGIKPVGAGRNYADANTPVRFVLHDTRFTLFSYTNLYPKSLEATADRPGISSFDLERAKERIRAVRSEADIVIVSFHWGEEYQTHSNALQQKIARTLIDAGADLIVGHHPHVVQEIEQYKGGWIMYSLGNFVFDQNFSDDTRKGLMAKVTVRDKKIERLEPIEIKFTNTFQPYIVYN